MNKQFLAQRKQTIFKIQVVVNCEAWQQGIT